MVLGNKTKAGIDIHPKTLANAYNQAFKLVKVGRASQPIAQAAVFVAQRTPTLASPIKMERKALVMQEEIK